MERRVFVGAAVALWLLFLVQAAHSHVLLDDWFQIRYWRDHEFGLASLWAYAHHNYFHYNPRIGELVLAIIDGSRAIHLVATPLVQLAILPIVFVIAFARWPRPTLRDLQLLLFIQVMIWLVIPIPGIMYFYRPFATNYLWAFAITLALFVPYRLGVGGERWLAPIMLVLGWIAGMCNEHTGPTAMVVMAAFVYAARRRLHAWMIAGMVGLFVGYPMLFFAPGQAVRYGGIATRDTPLVLLADRGVTGCLWIVGDFLYEARLGILVFVAIVIRYRALPPRHVLAKAGVIAGIAAAIVATLFVSPTTTDRVFYASGVLLVAAFAICAEHMYELRLVRRFATAACIVIFGYHVVRFVDVSSQNADRLALLAAAKPGSVAVVPRYASPERSRWSLGDDFVYYPWLRTYVGGELYDLARVDMDRRGPPNAVQLVPPGMTYRQLQAAPTDATIVALGLYDEPKHRAMVLADHGAFVDGRPYDDERGHFIRVRNIPAHLESTHILGCNLIDRVELVGDLVPVDERFCRGPFTVVMCEPGRCWVAGWY